FRVPGRAAVRVPLMHREATLRYAHNGVDGAAAAKLLELPFAGRDVAMVIVLPDADDGFTAVERALSAASLDARLDKLRKVHVGVGLPRFTIADAPVDLKGALTKLGMGRALAPGADFSGVTDAGGLYIDRVPHQAFVKVNEAGVEAGAATAPVSRDWT